MNTNVFKQDMNDTTWSVGDFLVAHFPRQNKRGSLLEYELQRATEDSDQTRCKVEKVVTLDDREWNKFSNSLLKDVDFLGHGGHGCDHPRMKEWDDVNLSICRRKLSKS